MQWSPKTEPFLIFYESRLMSYDFFSTLFLFLCLGELLLIFVSVTRFFTFQIFLPNHLLCYMCVTCSRVQCHTLYCSVMRVMWVTVLHLKTKPSLCLPGCTFFVVLYLSSYCFIVLGATCVSWQSIMTS